MRQDTIDRFTTLQEKSPPAFMVPQMIEFDPELIHPDMVDEIEPGEFLIRLSAPGYLDCTEWTIVSTPAEVEQWFYDFVEVE